TSVGYVRTSGENMKGIVRHFAVVVSSLVMMVGSSYAGADGSTPGHAAFGSSSGKTSSGDSGRFGIGVKTSLFGVGVEVAARVTHRINARAGFNILGYSRSFGKDGINYGGHLSFRTFEGHYDIFPFAGNFHVSPGVLAYMGN